MTRSFPRDAQQIIDCRTEITTAVTSWEQQLLETEEESASKGGATGGAALGGLRRSRSSMRSMQIDNDSGTKKKTLDHAALKAKASGCSRTRAEFRRSRTF